MIRANGAWTESLWPGPRGLSGLGAEAVAAIAQAAPLLAPALASPSLLPQLYGPRLGPMLPGAVLRQMDLIGPGIPVPTSATDSVARAGHRAV